MSTHDLWLYKKGVNLKNLYNGNLVYGIIVEKYHFSRESVSAYYKKYLLRTQIECYYQIKYMSYTFNYKSKTKKLKIISDTR